MQLKKIMPMLIIALLVVASSAISAAAFVQDKVVSGRYKGIAKSEAMGDLPITVNLINTSGKLSGAIETAQGAAAITGGTIDEATGAVKMTFDAGGTEGTVVATFKDGVITGKWDLGGMGGPIELKKDGAAAATPAPTPAPSTPAPSTPAPAGGATASLAGDFECSADVMGQAMPFTLKLKQEGDKITGESTSDQGTTAIANGKVVGNKLSFSIETPNGIVSFTSEFKDGKLVGKYDFAGQMTGDWSGKKK